MARFSDTFLQEVKDRCPLESVVADYVQLKRSGANLLGLCPFHREKTPSFTVTPSKQIYKCFGCGEGGSVFNFIMKMENVSFPDAVALLAKRAGLELPQTEDDDAAKRRQLILQMNREAARFYHACLSSEAGKAGYTYLTEKRQLPLSLIRHFGLGFAPERGYALLNHLEKQGYTQEQLRQSGLISTSKSGRLYDRFRNRVMFPIIDVKGNVIAFGGRVMDDSLPKYLNSPETLAFNKSRNLFGLNFAKNEKLDYILLAEGYMDVIALHGAGFRTAVASLGTSLTPDQARLITRYCKQVIICYDSDAAGVSASKRAIGILKEAGIAVRVLTISGGKDPDEFIKTYGAERFAKMLKSSEGYIEYRLERAAQNYDLSSIPQKVEFLKEATVILADIESDVERELYTEKVSKAYGITAEAMQGELKKVLGAKNKRIRSDQKRKVLELTLPKVITKEKDYNSKSLVAEQNLLALLYDDNDIYYKVREELDENDFLNSLNSRIFKLFSEKIESGQEVDVALLNEDFAADEVSYITGILSRESKYDDRLKAARDLIQVMRDERKRMVALSSDDEDLEGMTEWLKLKQQEKKKKEKRQ